MYLVRGARVKVPHYNPGNPDMVGWAGETTLDVEYAHAIAPGAKILLVETPGGGRSGGRSACRRSSRPRST